VLPLLEEQLTRGELRPVFLFDKVRTLRIDEDEIRRFDSDGSSFFNMNTPADYDEALTRWCALVRCTVELFGVARMLAGTGELDLSLPPGGTVSHVLAALVAKLPALAGRVITADGSRLMEGYACSVNGREFVRSPVTAVQRGDRILILSADAGG
jgi:molybdopterin converting factor small subunit